VTSFIVVDASKIHETPTAFQAYVARFFIEKKLLGRKVYVASTVLHWDHKYTQYGYKPQGIAPSHNCELDLFTTGLKGQRLCDWIEAAEGKYLWRFHNFAYD
jgi:hypothetical protein